MLWKVSICVFQFCVIAYMFLNTKQIKELRRYIFIIESDLWLHKTDHNHYVCNIKSGKINTIK